jgi:hypothetical protein
MKIPVAIILDEMMIQSWQQSSLDLASELIDVKLILNCTNTMTKKNYFYNFFYYVLNICCMRFNINRSIFFPYQGIKVLEFNSEYNGIWQSIPLDVISKLKKEKIKLVIKFGMNLLTISNELKELDIMSFHHGDPNEYRGRPAGFYEILLGAKKVGAVVQLLSNKLDGGKVASKGFSTIYQHSYKKTLISLYKNSAFLLKAAIINYEKNNFSSQLSVGKNYRLPKNLIVLKFIFKIFFYKLVRLFKAAFFEKRWNIALYDFSVNFLDQSDFSLNDSRIPQILKKYEFYADPFFSLESRSIRVEALNKWTRKGEIIELDIDSLNYKKDILSGHHFSYPFSIFYQNDEFLFPEAAEHLSACYFHLNSINDMKPIPIKGIKGVHITDPTVFKQDEYYYIFCNHLDSPNERLHLYLSDNFFGPFKEHPCSPIVIDPESARMAGKIFYNGSNLYRFGQDNCLQYGKEISVHKIVSLDPSEYIEERISTLQYKDSYGPHTINFQANQTVTDFYLESFSLIAGFKKLVSLITFKLSK